MKTVYQGIDAAKLANLRPGTPVRYRVRTRYRGMGPWVKGVVNEVFESGVEVCIYVLADGDLYPVLPCLGHEIEILREQR